MASDNNLTARMRSMAKHLTGQGWGEATEAAAYLLSVGAIEIDRFRARVAELEGLDARWERIADHWRFTLVNTLADEQQDHGLTRESAIAAAESMVAASWRHFREANPDLFGLDTPATEG